MKKYLRELKTLDREKAIQIIQTTIWGIGINPNDLNEEFDPEGFIQTRGNGHEATVIWATLPDGRVRVLRQVVSSDFASDWAYGSYDPPIQPSHLRRKTPLPRDVQMRTQQAVREAWEMRLRLPEEVNEEPHLFDLNLTRYGNIGVLYDERFRLAWVLIPDMDPLPTPWYTWVDNVEEANRQLLLPPGYLRLYASGAVPHPQKISMEAYQNQVKKGRAFLEHLVGKSRAFLEDLKKKDPEEAQLYEGAEWEIAALLEWKPFPIVYPLLDTCALVEAWDGNLYAVFPNKVIPLELTLGNVSQYDLAESLAWAYAWRPYWGMVESRYNPRAWQAYLANEIREEELLAQLG